MKKLTPIGARLVEAMRKANMSDSELAKKLGIAQPNIHTLKYITASPRYKTLVRISKILKTTPEALLGKNKAEKKEWGGRTVWLVVKENGKTNETRII